ncbi:MAG: hypothetical protein QOF90_159, partial [Acetobacteraceae bacterium]|nr:hypothetical protein [Acetobacteraceae bacterium]
MNILTAKERRASAALLCAALCFPTTLARAADNDNINALMQAIEKLQAENRDLARRLGALEAEKSARKAPAAHTEPAAVAQRKPVPETTQESPAPSTARTGNLEQRVTDLELTKTAQEDSVRTIIRDSFAKTGSNGNESVTLGGALAVTRRRASDISGH